MPISADVMELIGILNDEGFEVVAGELLTEIGLGRELPEYEADLEDSRSGSRFLGDIPPRREPIEVNDQLGYAMRFLRLRLVEPERRFAEAEQIAGRIQSVGNQHAQKSKATRIAFIPITEGDPAAIIRTVPPGDTTDADRLALTLARIASEVV